MTIIFLDSVHPILKERLTAKGYECIDASMLPEADCRKVIKQADGIVIRSRFTLKEAFLKDAVNLKFIARSGAGMENIDERYCADRNIVLFNAPEGNRNAVGEHALGMLLSLLNKLHTADREVRAGKWDREGNRGNELDGKIVGIIGYGNNGKAFAKKLRGFDVKILAYDKYKQNFGDHYVMECTLNAIMENADVISFHIPQNPETLFMANELFFSQLQKAIYLLNLSRGKIVKTSALVKSMQEGKVIAAGLDVLEYEKTSFEAFNEEKMPEDLKYLFASQNVILTPHVGGWTTESYFKLSNVLADKILEHFDTN
jgi:D-3-phosphoglycerate dehydrogenase